MIFFYKSCNLDVALFLCVASSALATAKSIARAIDRSLYVAIARYTLFKCVPAGKVKPAFATFAFFAFPISCALDTTSTAFFVVVNALVAEPRAVTLRTSIFGNRVEESFTKLTLRAKSAAGTSAAPSIFQTAFARWGRLNQFSFRNLTYRSRYSRNGQKQLHAWASKTRY